MSESRRQFRSDNNAGACPEVLEALQQFREGHVEGYGGDDVTTAAQTAIQNVFERNCAVFFVSTGTAANCLALAQIVPSYGAVLAHGKSHVNSDECHGFSFFSGGAEVTPA
jgi:threonine aldolase